MKNYPHTLFPALAGLPMSAFRTDDGPLNPESARE